MDRYNHGTTEYRGIFSRYLPWRKISGTTQHYAVAASLLIQPARDLLTFLPSAGNEWQSH